MGEGNLRWRYDAGNAIESGLVVGTDGVIYFGTNASQIIALYSDGTLKWEFAAEDPVYGALALSNDESVVYVCEEWRLVAINTTTGILEWSYYPPFAGGLYGGVIVDINDNIYFAEAIKGVVSVDKNGNFRWEYGNESESGFAIGKSNTVIYYMDIYDSLYELALLDGAMNWNYQGPTWGGRGTGIQIDGDGAIYYGEYGHFYAVNPDGTEKWRYPIANYAGTNNAIGTNGNIWFVDNNAANTKLIVLDPDGNLVWDYALPNWIGSSSDTTGLALDSNDIVYVGCYDYKLYAINQDGTPRWSYTAGHRIESGIAFSPAEDTVYFGSDDGYLYAVEIGAAPPAKGGGSSALLLFAKMLMG